MSANYNFIELFEREKECVMIPCVYDCGSALAAELSGAKATLLSGGELGESLLGKMEPLLTTDEVVHAVERICEFSPLPMIVDVGAGFDVPLNAYRTAKRMVKAGAKALLLGNEHGGQPWEEYEALLKATLKACEGSDCIVIARNNDRFSDLEGLKECANFLNKALAVGAKATMACGLCRTPKAKEFAKILGEMVPGWKIYPDQNSVNGIADVDNDVIYSQGYVGISYHYMMKVALQAMWAWGLENMKAKNNVPSNELVFPNGLKGHSALGC
ncbi:MAG: isocitrate lyase/phosphoenolpyruvate mutase family protein, partial [Sphaerochaetaceae bacterium]|nr:isocitrate lyase/phosphoenolpyruvate mutase family protein [Sphaerochaetaceae bacterium]